MKLNDLQHIQWVLARAVDTGVAFVPGAAFYAGLADSRAVRVSFVTASADEIDSGIAAFAAAIRETPALAGGVRPKAAQC